MAIDHNVTEHITQSGNQRLGRAICSCGIEVESEDLRKNPMRILKIQLQKIHETDKYAVVEDKKSKPKKNKKLKKIDEQIPPDSCGDINDDEPELQLDEDYDNESGDQS